MARISLQIKEQQGNPSNIQWHKLSVPFSLTAFDINSQALYLNATQQEPTRVFVEPLAYWPNGKVRWALCYFNLAIDSVNSKTLEFIIRDLPQSDYSFERSELLFEQCSAVDSLSLWLSRDNGAPVQLSFEQGVVETTRNAGVEKSYSQFTARLKDDSDVEFHWRVTQLSNQSQLQHELSIHNKNRALHPNGQWDLGDPNSFYFSSLELRLGNHKVAEIENSAGGERFEIGRQMNCQQVSSGGKNDKSAVHVNSEGKVPWNTSGFVLNIDGQAQTGERFEPILAAKSVTEENSDKVIVFNHFWQNFPSAISSENSEIQFGLFPRVGYQHELQPGERKKQTITFADAKSDFIDGSTIVVAPEYLQSVASTAFFAAENESSLQELVDLGLDPEVGFHAKQELIDEFGWRNFGDLYADHENSEFKGDDLIVSHYNNQYDPIYGFLRQYLKSGDGQWFSLADNLAKHVADIDIYHTDKDRAEYNNGLFWHTDHYVDAATASHRTYSKNQPQDVYMDHAGGGGPGGQHCYTSGLALHYFMTGNRSSKDAVLELCDWITNVYEGSGGVLDFALAVKNSGVRADLKNVKTGQYPLDRGTGNYIVALIDAYEVTGKQSYLDRASMVIKNTAYVDEDLDLRDLLNVEECWFYTVFLQAVGRYIWTKKLILQIDESYDYAVQLLLKFADWMAEHERPYLTKPDILEFPNQTWSAQDLRKVNVLLFASCLVPDGTPYRKKALEIREYIVSQLENDDERHYCRILCLLMQNEGMLSFVDSQQMFGPHQKLNEYASKDMASSLAKETLSRIKTLNVKQELEWLASRSDKVSKLLGKQ